MKQKIVKKILYEGLGFPVYLFNVPMIEVMGAWTPNINYGKLQKMLLLALAHKPYPLTGNEVKFIRLYFEMTMEDFGKAFDMTHAAISKWESKKNQPIKTDKNTDLCIRMFILDNLKAKNEELGKFFRIVSTIEIKQPKKIEPLSFDAKKEQLIAV